MKSRSISHGLMKHANIIASKDTSKITAVTTSNQELAKNSKNDVTVT
jgi:hypothetical protein